MILWLTLTLLCLFFQAAFSMIEMAALSFNRIRLQYLVSRNVKQALWLHELLKHPYRLFGTVMLSVNCALQMGSQSAREVYKALHLDPNLAPITQIFLVVVLAELAPLFAARRCSEHVIMLFTPLIFWTYRIFFPIIWVISLVIKAIYKITKRPAHGIELSKEQLQMLLESSEQEKESFNFLISNVLSMRGLTVRPFIYPLTSLCVIPHTATVAEAKKKLSPSSFPFLILYEKKVTHVTALVPLHHLCHASDDQKLSIFAIKLPVFSATTPLSIALEKLSKSGMNYAIVTGEKKGALGIVSLQTLFERLVCKEQTHQGRKKVIMTPVIERSVAGNMRIADFNREYGTHLPEGRAETLAQLMLTKLEGTANVGDHIAIGALALEAEETGLTGIKTVRVKSLAT